MNLQIIQCQTIGKFNAVKYYLQIWEAYKFSRIFICEILINIV